MPLAPLCLWRFSTEHCPQSSACGSVVTPLVGVTNSYALGSKVLARCIGPSPRSFSLVELSESAERRQRPARYLTEFECGACFWRVFLVFTPTVL